MKSNIFTDAETKSLEERLSGSRKDSTGIFSNRVKPKIIELLDVWFPKKKELEKAIKTKSKKGELK